MSEPVHRLTHTYAHPDSFNTAASYTGTPPALFMQASDVLSPLLGHQSMESLSDSRQAVSIGVYRRKYARHPVYPLSINASAYQLLGSLRLARDHITSTFYSIRQLKIRQNVLYSK